MIVTFSLTGGDRHLGATLAPVSVLQIALIYVAAPGALFSPGAVVTGSGRVSAAPEAAARPGPHSPFSPSQLARLDDALTLVSRHTRPRFSAYLAGPPSDRGGHLAVMSMTASFSEGDLVGGLLSDLRMLSDQAGRPH